MSARYIVQKALGISGNPIPSDEPCIVIRGQDILALEMIDHYIQEYQNLDVTDELVISELMDHRTRIYNWQQNHPVKVADR